jgi:hypothetical protein
MRENNKLALAELQRIANINGGLLRPSDVVRAAKAKTSPLHSRFQWNDTKAAQEYRLWQARQLIRVMVTVLPGGSEEPQRVWVSLDKDTQKEGYRSLVAVMSDKTMREALLRQSFEEMEYFQQKYEALTELSSVFSVMRKVRRKFSRKGQA